jgi:DNA sulfur modification protein DndD
MRLTQLELENFRQFRDETISFARGGDRNVTVIHGSNGSGKTTLLNAFTWLFYDEVSFESRPERLASEGAMGGADVGDRVTVRVQLSFDHEGAEYVATRTTAYEKQSNEDFDGEVVDADLTVEYVKNGERRVRNNPENTLDQIIPERLSELFFFDGEDIDELAGIDNQDQIQEAIQNIMGLTILERATRHLDVVAGRFEDELQEHGSDELQALIQEKRDLESDIEELERKRDDKERAKDRVKTEISDVEQTLSLFEDSRALQEQRETHLDKIDDVESEVDDINDQIRTRINDSGFVPLAMPLLRETAEKLDDLREQGAIPTELSNEFIDTLLKQNECICGRELQEGTVARERVAGLRGEATAEGVEQGALRIVGHLDQFIEKEGTFFEDVDELVDRRKEKHDEIDTLEEYVDEISSELGDIETETDDGMTVKELEDKRSRKESERGELNREIGQLEEKIESHQAGLEELEEDIAGMKEERAEARLAKRRQRAAELVRDEITDSFADLRHKVRRWSNEMVQDTFGEIASKELTAEITDEFELKIWQDVGDRRVEVDKSTGERQIASLAFVGSLVKIARDRYEADTDTDYFTGGIYPLVMDSPFGALDKSHRRQVGRVIPTLASQVVVFATDSQWEGPVEQEMEDRIGEQYWLNFDEGDGAESYPQTRIESEQTPVARR